MNIVFILIVIVGLLFAATYFTKRRFGVLGLALCAGYLLSTIWTTNATSFVEGAGIELLTPPLPNVVSAVLVLMPAVLLLFSGPTYSKQWQRIFGAAVFALLATSFLLNSITHGLTFDSAGQKVYDFLVTNRNLIVTLGIAYALYDILTLKTPKKKDEKK